MKCLRVYIGKTAGAASLLRKLGREQKRGMKREGRGEKFSLLPSPPPSSICCCCCCCSCFCYQTYFRAFTRSEMFVTQANVREEFNYTTGLLWDSYITAVSLFWDTNMVDVMSREKKYILTRDTRTQSHYPKWIRYWRIDLFG